MIPTPIHKVLSTFQKHGVRALLMGGQACVFYGAAQISKDVDFVLPEDEENFARMLRAFTELQAERIAVPPFDPATLARGHAVHFRCQLPAAQGVRVDVLTRLRDLATFEILWERRNVFGEPSGETFDLLSVPDLVRAKMTQRDKDWPVIRLLMEIHYSEHRAEPTPFRVEFWLRELRSPKLLIEVAAANREWAEGLKAERPLLAHALSGDEDALAEALFVEERTLRQRDREYWAPLKAEIEGFRRAERQG